MKDSGHINSKTEAQTARDYNGRNLELPLAPEQRIAKQIDDLPIWLSSMC